MEYILLALLLVLIVLVVVLLTRKSGAGDLEEKLNTRIRENLFEFQNQINQVMTTTRTEMSRSKDLISDHLVKSLDNMKQMGSTIQKLVQQQEDAAELGQSLKDLLQAPKLRGNYGEQILEELLEQVLPRGIWEKQYHIEGSEAVDAVVKFKEVVIPVDAKFPRDDYNRYLEAKEEGEKAAAWKKFEEAVKRQITSIKNKYIKPEKGTTPFALMFIPSEAVYYETIAETNYLGDPSKLYETARANSVVPVSPNTFYAFLQVLLLGIKNTDIIKGAKKLQESLEAMQKSFDFFFKQFEEIGKHLDKAGDAYRVGEGHVQRYKERLEGALKLETFEDKTIED